MNFAIRPLMKSDALAVATIIKQTEFRIVEPENLISRIEKLVDRPQDCWLVAERDGIVLGFGGLVEAVNISKGCFGWIEEVVTDKNVQEQGIATQVMVALRNTAKGRFPEIKLNAKLGLVRFYEKFGFIIKGEEYMVMKL